MSMKTNEATPIKQKARDLAHSGMEIGRRHSVLLTSGVAAGFLGVAVHFGGVTQDLNTGRNYAEAQASLVMGDCLPFLVESPELAGKVLPYATASDEEQLAAVQAQMEMLTDEGLAIARACNEDFIATQDRYLQSFPRQFRYSNEKANRARNETMLSSIAFVFSLVGVMIAAIEKSKRKGNQV